MEIPFSGRHSRLEYFRAVYAAYQPTFRMLINRGIFAVATGFLYAAYQINLSPDRALPLMASSRLIWHILAILVVIVLLVEPFFAPLFVAFRLWRDPSVRTERNGTIGANGILFSSSGRRIRWDAFRQVILRPDFIILKTGAVGFLSLPRSFFQNESDWKRMTKLAESKVHPITASGKASRLIL